MRYVYKFPRFKTVDQANEVDFAILLMDSTRSRAFKITRRKKKKTKKRRHVCLGKIYN